MKRRYLILLAFLSLFFTACFRLDSFLYEPMRVDAYLLDQYTGPQELKDELAFIRVPDSLIYQFSIPSANGKKIYGIYVGNRASMNRDTVILYCHGNSGNNDNYWPRTKLLWYAMQKHGIHGGVLLFDYQGFGASEGEAHEQSLYEDTYAMYQWLLEGGADPDKMILYGYSLGSAPATRLCYEHKDGFNMEAAKLVLESPFASAEVFVQDATLLAIPGSFMVNLEINNAEEIKEVTQPFLWIHGIDDHYIPMKTHGQVVYDNYRGEKKESLLVPGGHHSDVPAVYGVEKYADFIAEFISDY